MSSINKVQELAQKMQEEMQDIEDQLKSTSAQSNNPVLSFKVLSLMNLQDTFEDLCNETIEDYSERERIKRPVLDSYYKLLEEIALYYSRKGENLMQELQQAMDQKLNLNN